jgi:hypothetical protein
VGSSHARPMGASGAGTAASLNRGSDASEESTMKAPLMISQVPALILVLTVTSDLRPPCYRLNPLRRPLPSIRPDPARASPVKKL